MEPVDRAVVYFKHKSNVCNGCGPSYLFDRETLVCQAVGGRDRTHGTLGARHLVTGIVQGLEGLWATLGSSRYDPAREVDTGGS